MAARIALALNAGKRVLWLVCGGSNIPVAVETMDAVRSRVGKEELSRLTVALTDERYGPVGHKDSNWEQLTERGFDFTGIATAPVLVGRSLDTTVSEYAMRMKELMEAAIASGGLIIGLFGIGVDGHIAGALPGSPALDDPRYVSGYSAQDFVRITLTPVALKKVGVAYAFAFGASKKIALGSLISKDLPIVEQPSQILKSISEAFLCSDQV